MAEPLADHPGLEVVVDAVALPTKTVLQTHAIGVPGELFAKQGLVVRAGADVELSVESTAGARLEWGEIATTGATTRHTPCPGEGWLAYAGGYYVPAAMCLPVRVRSAGREQTVRIAVGAAC